VILLSQIFCTHLKSFHLENTHTSHQTNLPFLSFRNWKWEFVTHINDSMLHRFFYQLHSDGTAVVTVLDAVLVVMVVATGAVVPRGSGGDSSEFRKVLAMMITAVAVVVVVIVAVTAFGQDTNGCFVIVCCST
jgi:hypothetical protein